MYWLVSNALDEGRIRDSHEGILLRLMGMEQDSWLGNFQFSFASRLHDKQ